MYESYWHLRQKPFESGADPRFYFPGQSHQAALLKLRYAIENRREGARLVGASGLGKTLILHMLEAALDPRYGPFVELAFPKMPVESLMAYLAIRLSESDLPGAARLEQSVRRIETFLAENVQKGRHAVVVIDEAQLIEDRHTREAIRLLTNFEVAGRTGLTVLLSGQPTLLATLKRAQELDQRLAVQCLLRPFSEQETRDYVAHRLREAGATQAIFDPSALAALQQLTHGVPRQINRLCDLALLIGYAEQRKTLGAEQLEAVSQELLAVAAE